MPPEKNDQDTDPTPLWIPLAVIFIFMRVKGAGEDRVRRAMMVAGAAVGLGVALLLVGGVLFALVGAGGVR